MVSNLVCNIFIIDIKIPCEFASRRLFVKSGYAELDKKAAANTMETMKEKKFCIHACAFSTRMKDVSSASRPFR
jgi:hypothetical protein